MIGIVLAIVATINSVAPADWPAFLSNFGSAFPVIEDGFIGATWPCNGAADDEWCYGGLQRSDDSLGHPTWVLDTGP